MARKIKLCLEEDCKNAQTSKGYCRLHYIKNWKTLKQKEKRRAAKKLSRYVEGIAKSSSNEDYKGHEADYYNGEHSQSSEVESLIEDLGYSDPDSLDEIISNLKIDR